MKGIVDSVYETKKMLVRIGPEEVSKTFKKTRKAETRYLIEKKAFEYLRGLEGFPQLLSVCDKTMTLKMSRLPGCRPESLGETQIVQLRLLIKKMLERGVARHAIPIRDLLVSEEGKVSLVDFERVTFRSFEYSPVWIIAKIVTKYHLYRLADNHHPGMLTGSQRFLLKSVNVIRSVGKPLRAKLNHVRKSLRGKPTEKS